MDGVPSGASPIRTLHTVSLWRIKDFKKNIERLTKKGGNFRYLLVCLEAPTFCGEELSLHASIIFLRMNRHSRNMEKKGWWEMMQRDVRE